MSIFAFDSRIKKIFKRRFSVFFFENVYNLIFAVPRSCSEICKRYSFTKVHLHISLMMKT